MLEDAVQVGGEVPAGEPGCGADGGCGGGGGGGVVGGWGEGGEARVVEELVVDFGGVEDVALGFAVVDYARPDDGGVDVEGVDGPELWGGFVSGGL